MRINLTTPMSDDKERQRDRAAIIAAIEQYTEERMNDENTNGSRSDGPVLLPCGHCGEQCADLIIDQGDKWAHYSASCLEVRTGYNISEDAPWRAEAIAAYNKRQPTPSDALQAENEQLRHDLERQMAIANEHVNEVERLRDALEAAPIISLWESKEDFRRRQDGWLKTKYRAALERSE